MQCLQLINLWPTTVYVFAGCNFLAHANCATEFIPSQRTCITVGKMFLPPLPALQSCAHTHEASQPNVTGCVCLCTRERQHLSHRTLVICLGKEGSRLCASFYMKCMGSNESTYPLLMAFVRMLVFDWFGCCVPTLVSWSAS